MGVVISKPAINIREQLTELKAQQGYEERQFHFDNLVTNGTFDTDTDWTKSSAWSISGGKLNGTATGGVVETITQTVATVAGATYQISFDVDAVSGNQVLLNAGSSSLGTKSVLATGTQSYTFVSAANNEILQLRFSGASTAGDTITIDNISIYTSDGTDVAFTMPKGWKPLHVYDDGVLQREGSAEDYEVTFDGFNYYVKPTVATPGARNTVIGVRA